MAIGSLLVLVTAALIVPGVAMLGRRDADPRGLGRATAGRAVGSLSRVGRDVTR